MPPYLRKLYKAKCAVEGCPKDAQHELYNEVNGKIADYCDKHAAEKLAEALKDFEKSLGQPSV